MLHSTPFQLMYIRILVPIFEILNLGTYEVFLVSANPTMADPISISVGALVSLCNIAWHVYELCKDVSESFKNISSEVLSLHAILREAEENLGRHSNTRVEGLTTVVAGCRDVLTDLETLVGKYKGLSSKTQRVWDRMGWHTEDIAELRLRLISNTSLLAAFMR